MYGGGAVWLPVWFGGVWSRLEPTAEVVDGEPTVPVVGDFRVEFRDMALGRFFILIFVINNFIILILALWLYNYLITIKI